jgi:hypothetical protein
MVGRHSGMRFLVWRGSGKSEIKGLSGDSFSASSTPTGFTKQDSERGKNHEEVL